MSFNENLVALRKNAGFTQQDLADTVNVSIDSVRRWESGKQEPRLSDLKTLASALGVTIGDLVDENSLYEKVINDKRVNSKVKNNKEKINKIVIRYGQFALEIPANDRGYDFLNSKIKEIAINDNLLAHFINETESNE